MSEQLPNLEGLVAHGYAPGSYFCFCGECGKQHTADKRAWRCLECAEKRADTAIPRTEADAMVAAALEQCAVKRDAEADYWRDVGNPKDEAFNRSIASELRAAAKDDQRAALDAIVREAGEAGYAAGHEKGFEDGRAMAHQHDKIFDDSGTELLVREAVEAERERVHRLAVLIGERHAGGPITAMVGELCAAIREEPKA